MEVSKLLGIKLASYRYAGDPYPLAGFPVASLSRYLKVLVNDSGLMVAIANQHLVNGSPTEVDRKVVRIITPGTLIDEDFIDPFANRYLLALDHSSGREATACDLAWLDLTTGAYWSDTVPLRGLKDEIARIAPKEIVTPTLPDDDPIANILRKTPVPVASVPMPSVRCLHLPTVKVKLTSPFDSGRRPPSIPRRTQDPGS